MMGKGHALTGVLAAVGTASVLHSDVPTLILMCTSLPGAALIPDIDHARATVSNTFGPITRVFSLVLGHRRETHSIPGIMSIGFGTYFAAVHAENIVSKVWLTIVLILIWSAAIRLLKIRGWLDDILPVPVAIAIVWFGDVLTSVGIPPFPLKMIAPCLVVGMLVHVAGDVLTKQGCPLMWPFSKKRTTLGLFRAGSWVERWPVTILIIGGIGWFGYSWIIGTGMIK